MLQPIEIESILKVGLTRQEASDELDFCRRALSISLEQIERRALERFAFGKMAEQTGYVTFAMLARLAEEYADVKETIVIAEKKVVALLQDFLNREPFVRDG